MDELDFELVPPVVLADDDMDVGMFVVEMLTDEELLTVGSEGAGDDVS